MSEESAPAEDSTEGIVTAEFLLRQWYDSDGDERVSIVVTNEIPLPSVTVLLGLLEKVKFAVQMQQYVGPDLGEGEAE